MKPKKSKFKLFGGKIKVETTQYFCTKWNNEGFRFTFLSSIEGAKRANALFTTTTKELFF